MADALESFLIEQRHSSQEVTRFMRALFAGEMVAEAALPQDEIRAMAAAAAADRTPAVAVTTELTPAPAGTLAPLAPPGAIPIGRPVGLEATLRARRRALTALFAARALVGGASAPMLPRPSRRQGR